MAAPAPIPAVAPNVVALLRLPDYGDMPCTLRDIRDHELKWPRYLEKLNPKEPALHFSLWIARFEASLTAEDVWLPMMITQQCHDAFMALPIASDERQQYIYVNRILALAITTAVDPATHARCVPRTGARKFDGRSILLAITNVYREDSAERATLLTNQLLERQWSPNQSASDFFQGIVMLRDELRGCHAPIPDNIIHTILASRIPEDFVAVHAWMYGGVKTVEEVWTRVEKFEQQRSLTTSITAANTAVETTTAPVKKCFYCFDPGHVANRCPIKRADRNHGIHRADISKAPSAAPTADTGGRGRARRGGGTKGGHFDRGSTERNDNSARTDGGRGRTRGGDVGNGTSSRRHVTAQLASFGDDFFTDGGLDADDESAQTAVAAGFTATPAICDNDTAAI